MASQVDMTSWLLTPSRRTRASPDALINPFLVQLYARGLIALWQRKKQIRTEREAGLLKAQAENVAPFDIYDLEADALDDVNKDLIDASLFGMFRKYAYKGTRISGDTNGLLVMDSSVGVPPVLNILLPDVTMMGESEARSPWNRGRPINIFGQEAPKGLKQLALAIFGRMESLMKEQLPSGWVWRNVDSPADTSGGVSIIDTSTKISYSKQVFDGLNELLLKRGFQSRTTFDDRSTESVSKSVTGLIKDMLSLAAFRSLGLKIRESKSSSNDKDSTEIEPDDSINPDVVETKSLDKLLRMSQQEVQQEANRRLTALYAVLLVFEEVIGLNEPGGVKERILGFFKSLVSRPVLAMTEPLHMTLVGPPGTGKTTVAELVANGVKALGVLSSNRSMASVNRSTFVAPFEGQTAIRSRKALLINGFENVVFFDEAYQLVQGKSDSYGYEGLTALFQFLNDYPEFIIIFAGYEAEIDRSLFANQPGLARRVAYTILLEGYSPEEMYLILDSIEEKLKDRRDAAGTIIRPGSSGGFGRESARNMMKGIIQREMSEDVVNQAYARVFKVYTEVFLTSKQRAEMSDPLQAENFAQNIKKSEVQRLLADALLFGNYAGDLRSLYLLANRIALSKPENGGMIYEPDVQEAYLQFQRQKNTRFESQVTSLKNK